MGQTRGSYFPKNMLEKGTNLGLMAVAVFYIMQIVFNLQKGNMCTYFATDYCAFWSAGSIANTVGYAEVYDLNVVRQTQRPLYTEPADPEAFPTIPIPFFPVFILPFQLFALLDPYPGYVIWTFINLFGFIGYSRFFTQKLFGHFLPFKFSLMMLLSLPVFLNLFLGQVNLWLMICTGEFIRATLKGKPYRAGLWLSGLILKPQLLFLILPILLFQRMGKVLLSFGASGMVLFLISLGLAKIKGIHALINLWLGYTKGLPSNMPEVMMNWRMIAVNLRNFSLSPWGWTITVGGILGTLFIVFLLWRKPVSIESPDFHIAFLGMLAATGLVAWHSHVSTSMILIPTFVILYCRNQLPQTLFASWVFLPPAMRFVAPLLLAILLQVPFLSFTALNTLTNILNLSFGLPGLILNVGILLWSYKMIMGHRKLQFVNGML